MVGHGGAPSLRDEHAEAQGNWETHPRALGPGAALWKGEEADL